VDAPGLDPAHNDPPDVFGAILIGAYIFKKSHFAVAAHHPMVWSVAIWAAGHLLSNGSSADLLLFGAFLVWAVANLRSSYARDRRNAMTYPAPNWGATIGAVLLGVVMWIALLGGLHLRLVAFNHLLERTRIDKPRIGHVRIAWADLQPATAQSLS